MDDYAAKAANSEAFDTWTEFVKQLQSEDRQMAPEKSVQQKLENLCLRIHLSVSVFAEQFRLHAHKSSYADVEFIWHIDKQQSHDIQMVMITQE